MHTNQICIFIKYRFEIFYNKKWFSSLIKIADFEFSNSELIWNLGILICHCNVMHLLKGYIMVIYSLADQTPSMWNGCLTPSYFVT